MKRIQLPCSLYLQILVLIISFLSTDSFSNFFYKSTVRNTLPVNNAFCKSHQRSTSNAIFNKHILRAASSKKSPPVIEAEGSGSPCRIKVIGVGGGGGNAVNRMMESSTGVLGVELWAVNTDAQALSRNLAPKKLNIGNVTSR